MTAGALLRLAALTAAFLACSAGPAWANNYKVTKTHDSGSGTLRRAIELANSHRGYDAVIFELPGSGPHTIAPASPLPPITDGLKVQGYSEVGARENTRAVGSNAVIKIELSGWRAGGGADGLVIRAGKSQVTGLAINGFGGDGVEITSRSNKIVGNYIGTDPAGERDRGNGAAGVRVRGGSLNQIGEGTSHHNRNVISGNGSGVAISGSGSLDNRLLNSYVGLDADGVEDLGNFGDGVVVDGARSTDISTGITSRINIISGNDGNGVKVVGGTGTRVANNRIGTNASATADVGNRLNGIRVVNSPNNLIGDGEQPCSSCWGGKPLFGAGNVVSGNDESGVQLEGNGTRGNRVLNSQIGTDPGRRRALGNRRHGVAIVGGARDNFVGGVRREAWETNEIAHNGANGVMVASGATGNAIFSNSTFSNRGLAIDLNSDGVTGNDGGDRDGGPNGLQNYPVLSSARRAGSTTTIRGSLNSNPNTQLTVQFFTSPSSDPSGHGEGKRLLGKAQVKTNGHGASGLSFATKSAPSGSVVTATATRGWYQRASGSSSEVSRAVAVR